jgi:DNA invertase Pin-like site-specific DNA recombinase
MTEELIPAAQYLRMSTDRQEYSIANQSQRIADYAARWGFKIVQTYSDPATSGVLLRRRKGLQLLIQDVVNRKALYKAILVYDVSRWGRFQDTDESAHYEFMCKSAGVPVHYCAEIFSNDDTLPSMIMKSLKRVMAREFSREMGVKVADGQRRGATLGFRQGAIPGYGLRRYLISEDKKPKQLLRLGERKGLSTDRVVLVPGPAQEVGRVRQIYKMFLNKQMTFADIARELNRRRVSFVDSALWNPAVVKRILTHPKYAGWNVYGRTTRRMYTPTKGNPRTEWVVVPNAFKPLVSLETFAHAQELIARMRVEHPRYKSDEELLDKLRSILAKNGRITVGLINQTPGTPSTITYRRRFGTLGHAYELIGYSATWGANWVVKARRIKRIRADLMKAIVDFNPTRLSVYWDGGHSRRCLRTDGGRLVSVNICRPVPCYDKAIRWFLRPVGGECHFPILVVRLNLQCDAVKDIFLLPAIGTPRALYLKDIDKRLEDGVRLKSLDGFCEALDAVIYHSVKPVPEAK